VYVIDRDGAVVSKFNHNLSMAGTESPVAIDGDDIYIAGPGNSTDSFVLYALRPDGSVRWSRPTGGSAPVNVYAFNGTVCAFTEVMDGHRLRPVLYVLNQTGSPGVSYFSGDGRPWAQAVIVPGHVYARTYGGILYAFDA
jgi:outer membrane protein assembly factor BamB